ncbi:MAG: type I restriction enzyme HsdR N-terminal domain-containing protein [Chloroflexi bacterium]|nr:type I restriction enzyme HsdR N-terminal domain-containing protein [Chloroflexota bacterium]
MQLFARISEISSNINGQHDILLAEDEDATKRVSVTPFIDALGYNVQSLLEVRTEFVADSRAGGNEKVDYAVMHDGHPILLVEAKRALNPLSEKSWRKLHDYFGATDVRFAILTNGIKYLFYTDIFKRNQMDKRPFLILDLLNLDKKQLAHLNDFTKERFDVERNLKLAHRLLVFHVVKQEFEQPSDELVAHFAKLTTSEKLSTEEAHAFETSLREGIDKYINDRVSAGQFAFDEIEYSRPKTDNTDDVKDMLISNERRKIAIPVSARYEGGDFNATLLLDPYSNAENSYQMRKTKIRFDGEEMGVNDAELKARRTIAPDATQQWRGWRRWKVREPNTGKLRSIKDLLTDDKLIDQFR